MLPEPSLVMQEAKGDAFAAPTHDRTAVATARPNSLERRNETCFIFASSIGLVELLGGTCRRPSEPGVAFCNIQEHGQRYLRGFTAAISMAQTCHCRREGVLESLVQTRWGPGDDVRRQERLLPVRVSLAGTAGPAVTCAPPFANEPNSAIKMITPCRLGAYNTKTLPLPAYTLRFFLVPEPPDAG